ncbi:MAG: iron-sulfur cluster assembly accessory protein [Deltaproteobacteria bacterium]|nr:iron-sulfur cluster assembly accessory protein [Deltaproteobacteria bacterium]
MITLTENAAKEIRKVKEEEGMPLDVPVRIGIKGGGCSGFTYTFEFDSKMTKMDLEFQSQGIHILVDKKSHIYIDGTEVDWSYDLMDRGLKFKNPAAKGSCGCGTSFIYDPQEKQKSLPTLPFEL